MCVYKCLFTLKQSMFMTIYKWVARKCIPKRGCIFCCSLPSPSSQNSLLQNLKKPIFSIVMVVHSTPNINSSDYLCSSKIRKTLTQVLYYTAILHITRYCLTAEIKMSISFPVHALQMTHHMKHGLLQSTTFHHFLSCAKFPNQFTFLMVSRMYYGRKNK